jgi:hypothetical protein
MGPRPLHFSIHCDLLQFVHIKKFLQPHDCCKEMPVRSSLLAMGVEHPTEAWSKGQIT